MGTILSCDCGAKNNDTADGENVTPMCGDQDKNPVKYRQSTTQNSPDKFKTLSSARRGTLEPSKFEQYFSDFRPREETDQNDSQPIWVSPRRYSTLAKTQHRPSESKNMRYGTRSERNGTSTYTPSVRSSEFVQDNEIVHQLFEELQIDQNLKNFKGVARSLVSLVELLRDMTLKRDEYEDYDDTQLNKTKNQAFKKICQTVQEMISGQEDAQDLLAFAYELRKIDLANKYSKPILGQNLKSEALIKIICSNEWNLKSFKMDCSQSNKFKLKMQKGNHFIQLRKNFGPNLQIPILEDSKPSLMFCDTLQVQLKKQGTVVITCNGCRLACQTIDQNGADGSTQGKQAVWVKNSHQLFDSEQATEWVLTPTQFRGQINDNPNVFFLEMHFDDPCDAFTDCEIWRLVFNLESGCLDMVDQFSQEFKDYSWTNKWNLLSI